MADILLEIMYIIMGSLSLIAGIYAFRDNNNPARIGTGIFWSLLGLIFILGQRLPATVVGGALLVMGLLSMFKQIKITNIADSTNEFKEDMSTKLGNKIWIPTLSIGVLTMIFAMVLPFGGLVALGIASVLSFAISAIIIKESPIKGYGYDAPRLIHSMGAAIILPQLLGSLGAIFSKANVGTYISELMSSLVPLGNPLVGVTLYCVSMALFTMIMGNGFAAFSVITAGIGVPFVIAIGGDPLVVGTLGLTAGYCGTLMTPMAANFNVVPVSVMEINDNNGIIKAQVPMALILLVIHIALMYFLAF